MQPTRSAFLVLIVYAALWIVFKPETFEWHAVATLATWAMTLVIQRTEHRDTQAIHANSRGNIRIAQAPRAAGRRRHSTRRGRNLAPVKFQHVKPKCR